MISLEIARASSGLFTDNRRCATFSEAVVSAILQLQNIVSLISRFSKAHEFKLYKNKVAHRLIIGHNVHIPARA